MFAKATNTVGFAQRVVAMLVAGAVLMWSIGIFNIAQAANLTEISDTLSTSEPGVTAAHTISFAIPAGSALADGDTVTITFEAGSFSVGALASGDITVTVDTLLDGHASFATTSESISFDSVAAGADAVVEVAIPDGFITTTGASGASYEVTVDTGTGGDVGKTRVAVVDTVSVTASISTSFDFIVSGKATSTAVNGTSTTGSTTPTTIPFGNLVAGGVYTMAQGLSVATNARNGFSVTVQTDGDLESSTGAIIDTFANGTDISTAGQTWAANPLTNDVNDETTWGHWGMTYDDDATVDLGANEFVAASTTPREVFSHNGPSDGTTTNIGTTTVGYQVEITALQEAADDYSTIITYVATPTF